MGAKTRSCVQRCMDAAIRDGRYVVYVGAVFSVRFFDACRCGVVGRRGFRYGFDRALRLLAAAAVGAVERYDDRQPAGSPLEPLEQCGVRSFFRRFARSGIVPYSRPMIFRNVTGGYSGKGASSRFSPLRECCRNRRIGNAGRHRRQRIQRFRFSSLSFCNSYMRSRYFAAARKSSDLAARSISSFAFAISASRFSLAT